MAIFLGSATEKSIEEMMAKCFSRTLVARGNFEGKEYEARHCITRQGDRASMEGDWQITITGAMKGSGSAQLGSGGIGTWKSTATVVGLPIPIDQQGPAEIIFRGGQCVLRIKTATATGTVMGYTYPSLEFLVTCQSRLSTRSAA